MDYRALGEMIMMSMIGLSLLAIVTTLSFHFVLRPFLERILTGRGDRASVDPAVARRLETVESRLLDLEGGLERIAAAADFDRRLVAEGRRGEDAAAGTSGAAGASGASGASRDPDAIG